MRRFRRGGGQGGQKKTLSISPVLPASFLLFWLLILFMWMTFVSSSGSNPLSATLALFGTGQIEGQQFDSLDSSYSTGDPQDSRLVIEWSRAGLKWCFMDRFGKLTWPYLGNLSCSRPGFVWKWNAVRLPFWVVYPIFGHCWLCIHDISHYIPIVFMTFPWSMKYMKFPIPI